jgi:hypothetical protein
VFVEIAQLFKLLSTFITSKRPDVRVHKVVFGESVVITKAFATQFTAIGPFSCNKNQLYAYEMTVEICTCVQHHVPPQFSFLRKILVAVDTHERPFAWKLIG